MDISEILNKVADGTLSPADAENMIATEPFEKLGEYACLDMQREQRTGFPEVVFCQGKTCDQTAEIFVKLYEKNGLVLGTRATDKQYDAVKAQVKDAQYHRDARCITAGVPEKNGGVVAVCTAGTTDIPVAEEACITASMCGAQIIRVYDVGVAGIQRLLSRIDDIRKADAVIAAAGMEGALATVIGGLVRVPVIGLPTSIGYGASFGGVSALLAMLSSCAAGTSVVNIDNGFGAGYTAALIAGAGRGSSK
jgi:NCAIR mutase (PurE)-related protein